jgi:uncharacterized protein YecT (DUF1311 family)
MLTLRLAGLRHAMLLILPCTSVLAADCTKNPDRWLDDQCRQQTVQETSAQVERAVADLAAKADDTRRPLLIEAHRAWLAYRDRQCKLEFDTTRVMHSEYPRHGTMAPLLEQHCHIRLNDSRLLELQALAKR